jgi:hypothetical protein
MAQIIKKQNAGILSAWWKHEGKVVTDNLQLAQALRIEAAPTEYSQDYVVSNVSVKVI